MRQIPLDPARAGEVFTRAAGIIANRAEFGEMVWLMAFLPLLWAVGRWGKKAGWWKPAQDPHLTGQVLVLLAVMFLFYLPYFYMWDPVYNPIWTMEHTFKRGFFRFIPGMMLAFVSAPPVLMLLRKCDARG